METILVTGSAGFIGAAVTKSLLEKEHKVIGIDNLNNYYSKSLKIDRLKNIENNNVYKKNYIFKETALENQNELNSIFQFYKPSIVINLAAQAGVRYSLENPYSYADSNLSGFLNILECCRHNQINHLVYASSSSVYGRNRKIPFSEKDSVDNPISLYAATKRSNELMANTYSHLYGLPATGLRFFTVYGPWGRPDMAPMIFSKAILEGDKLEVFNHGKMKRDFTYIDDVVEGVVRCAFKSATPNPPPSIEEENPSHSFAPHRIFNVGNSKPVELLKFIELIENNLGKKANKIMKPIQPGDVKETLSESSALEAWIDYKPSTTIEEGTSKFIDWYKSYFSD